MKAWNIVGIIVAWVLSIAMVLMLAVAPLSLSALSLLDAKNITDLVGEALQGVGKPAAAVPQEEYAFQKLSAENEAPAAENPAIGNVLGGINMDSIKEIFEKATK